MKIVVLDAATLGTDLDLSPLSELGEVTVYVDTAAAQAQERLRDADVAVVNKLKMNEKTLDGTAVKLVCVAATGYNSKNCSFVPPQQRLGVESSGSRSGSFQISQ